MRHWVAALAALAMAACGKPGDPNGSNGAAAEAPDPGGGDWPQWGRTPSKNMVSEAKNLPFTFDPGKVKQGEPDLATAKNVLWVAKLGSQTYGNPTVVNGRVYVGTNNEGRGDPRFKGDHSVAHCLDAATGKVIWSLTVPKLGTGKVGDWEYLGICSSPTVVDDRVYLVTNRCEVMALDVNGLSDGNQGYPDEAKYMSFVGTTPGKPVEVKPTDADIIWKYDMIQELGVFPHNICSTSILVVGDVLYLATSNGVTYDHLDIPSPKAPALVALNRKTAELPGAKPADVLVGEEGAGISWRILHGNWSSVCWGEVGGKGVVLFGGPDGLLYSFDPNAVKDADGFGVLPERWRHDCNPPEFRYRDGDRSQPLKYALAGEGPSEVLATPVFYKGRVYAPIGQDPEHGEGVGNFTCLDVATGKKVWELRIDRSLSTCSIANDRVYAADHTGWLHCIDANDGTAYWRYDTGSRIWCSTLFADDKVYLGNADGIMTVVSTPAMNKLADELGAGLEVRRSQKKLVVRRDGKALREVGGEEAAKTVNDVRFPAPIHCTPVVARGVLYVATMRHLYAIQAGGK